MGALAAGLIVLGALPAQAHPLGNFTVNHYNGLSLYPDRIDLLAVVDRAELPSAQELPDIDADGSGEASEAELAAYATGQCPEVAAAVSVEVGGVALDWTIARTSLDTVPGVANLPTLRLTCALSAPAELAGPATVTIEDAYADGRIGWREITAVGDGVRLLDSPVPAQTVSDELRAYPQDLLSSPLDLRAATLRTEPGEGSTGGTIDLPGGGGDPFTALVARADRYVESLIGPDLTPLVGGLAIALSVLLGAGHALLPGHGKTVMAAYLAGRRGSTRDAVTVGATVTLTHTAGVLVLGLLISLFSGVAGEQVLRWLGVGSGLLVAGIGVALLRSALVSRRRHVASALRQERALVAAATGPATGLAVGVGGHPHPHSDHDHTHHDHTDHDHADHDHPGHDHHHEHPRHEHADHGHAHREGDAPRHDHEHPHAENAASHHDHGHDHDHASHHDPEHGHDHGDHHEHGHHDDEHEREAEGGHSHGFFAGHHHHGPGGHTHEPGAYSRRGLVGMGIAGGMVPSPSALVVLLASIGLGRTVFGVVLVLAYGLGMAGVLTAVGLLLVRLRGRLAQLATSDRLRHRAATLGTVLPVLTACLVLLVGVSLAARGILSPV